MSFPKDVKMGVVHEEASSGHSSNLWATVVTVFIIVVR